MTICSRCGTENDVDVKFCRECGNNLTINVNEPTQEDLKSLADTLNANAATNEKQPFNLNKILSDLPKNIWNKVRESIFFRKKKNAIITLSSILLIAILTFGVLNSGYIAFTTAYNMGNYDAAKSIQEWAINSDAVKADIKDFVIAQMNDYYEDFRTGKITYDEANEKFDIAIPFCNDRDAKIKATNLKNSQDSFSKAGEYEKKGDVYNATLEYLNVIEDDENYAAAQEKIKTHKPTVKQQAITQMQKCVAANDFNTGLKLVENMEKIFSNDTQINNYKKDFEARKEAHRVQQLKNNQKVKVIKAYAYNDGYYTIFRKATVIVQNCSNQVIKEYTVGILQFDNNGYPVDVEYSYQGDDNCFMGKGQSANVQPGSTYGGNRYWNIADKATKLKACVKSAEFYDGTVWTNPYYAYWLEAEKDRY